ncbi:MAG: trypsin-like serine peptidase [Gammaproteobacteria bacterium]
MNTKNLHLLPSLGLLSVLAGGVLSTNAIASEYIVKQVNGVTSATAPVNDGLPDDGSIDYRNAVPMPLPKAPAPASPADSRNILKTPSSGKPGSAPGSIGTGQESPTDVPQSEFLNTIEDDVSSSRQSDAVVPQDFGQLYHPFTTARVANNISDKKQDKTYKSYPYRAAGKLFFNVGGGTATCSAALIKPGIVVTAAHCVMEFGTGNGFYSNWVFIPAYHNGKAPFGKWYGFSIWVLASYANGTETCAVAGVVCPNDVAVIAVSNRKLKKFPGKKTGWYGYGWDGAGFTNNFPGFPNGLTHISQLGYPGGLDSAEQMLRNDSFGYTDTSLSNNTVIGSLMNEGSSGGPWVVNLGIAPALSGVNFGLAPTYNQIVGVTSWGYVSSVFKEQGASPFTSSNIVPLVNAVCSDPNVPSAACTL